MPQKQPSRGRGGRDNPGRPPIDNAAKTVIRVRLTDTQIQTAKQLGDGNINAGIRTALEAFKK